jgi:uncharacterized membrane protein HdeD (DUF308 family)
MPRFAAEWWLVVAGALNLAAAYTLLYDTAPGAAGIIGFVLLAVLAVIGAGLLGAWAAAADRGSDPTDREGEQDV